MNDVMHGSDEMRIFGFEKKNELSYGLGRSKSIFGDRQGQTSSLRQGLHFSNYFYHLVRFPTFPHLSFHYIYIYREREREKEIATCRNDQCIYVSIDISTLQCQRKKSRTTFNDRCVFLTFLLWTVLYVCSNDIRQHNTCISYMCLSTIKDFHASALCGHYIQSTGVAGSNGR